MLSLSSLLEDKDCLIWLAPVGALEEGEAHREAARRECWEETGVEPTGELPCVWRRDHEWTWSQRPIVSVERYFFARVDAFELEALQLEGDEEGEFSRCAGGRR